MSAQLALLPHYLTAHLQLTLVALLLGAAFSIPVGVWVTGRPRAERAVLAVASVIQTIPSLALLAIMVPALAALGSVTVRFLDVELRSIGYLPAIIGLTLYSVLPMLRNTVTGIAGVDPALIEAARGVGMTRWQRLRLVQLPLALPVIVAGVRTATVWVVGIATLSTPVGAASLGNYIFSGLQTRNLSAILVGCVAAAALALLLDGLVHLLEVGARDRRRALVATALLTLGGLYAYTGVTLAASWRSEGGSRVVIGAKTFTEQYILSALIARHLEHTTGVATTVVPSLGSTVAFDALASGALDVYVDYSGTIWATIMQRRQVPPDPATVLPEVGRYLAREHGVTLVGPLGFENAYALAVRDAQARRLDLTSISSLAPHAPTLAIAGDYEFFGRPEWRAIRKTYHLTFAEQRSMDSSLMYQAVASGQVDVISAFSTDGRIAALDLRVLRDDRHAIPPYDAVILANGRLARELPQVLDALTTLVGTIDAATMRGLNAAVDQEGADPSAVAQAFLVSRRSPARE
jgi:osmoprotectant transport system permease protein